MTAQPTRWLAALAAAVLIALVLVVMLDDEHHSAAPAASTASADARPASEPSSSSALPATGAPELDAQAAVARRALPLPAADESAPSSSEPGMQLTVVDGLSGAPLAGARVQWVRQDQAPEAAATDLGFGRRREIFEALLDEFEQELTTDAEGRARLPMNALGGYVFASWRDRSASEWIGEGSPDDRLAFLASADDPALRSPRARELRLFSPRGLAVRVVDEAGIPRAGVDVCLRATGQDVEVRDRHGELVPQEVAMQLWEGRTEGAQGTARIQDVEQLLRDYTRISEGWQATRAQLEVDLDLPFDRSAAVALEPDSAWFDTVELVLPPLGSMQLEIVDEAGLRTHVNGQVSLRSVVEQLSYRSPRWQSWTLLDGGRASYGQVELDREYSLLVRFEDDRPELQATVSGPTREEPDARIQLVAPPALPLVRAVIVAADGRSLVGEWVALEERVLGVDGELLEAKSTPVLVRPGGAVSARLRLDATRDQLHELQVQHPHVPGEGRATARATLWQVEPNSEVDVGLLRLERP